MYIYKARIFLLVDYQDFFSDLGSGGRTKKNSENDQLTDSADIQFMW